MPDNRALFNWLDEEILSCKPAMQYAREHLNEIISSASQNCVRKVYTTRGYELGIACPSLINHRVIGGHKRGRILKAKPENADYCEIGYDKDGEPLYFKDVNTFRTETTDFFFRYDGYIWVMELERRSKEEVWHSVSTYDIRKYRYDEKGRIHFYASMSASGHANVNLYEYPEDPEQPIICHMYYYSAFMEATEDLTSDYSQVSQFSAYRYEITPDLKTITEYRQKDGEFLFSRKIEAKEKKAGKPKAAADSFQRFSEWLDAELEKEFPGNGGIYFDLFQPAEDGFGIYFCVTQDFDAEDDDWACYVTYSSENMHMVQTSGLLEWEDALQTAAKLIRKYLREGKHKRLLRTYAGIGTSFADGEIIYLYARQK